MNAPEGTTHYLRTIRDRYNPYFYYMKKDDKWFIAETCMGKHRWWLAHGIDEKQLTKLENTK